MKIWKKIDVDVLLLNHAKVANAHAITGKSHTLCSVVTAMVIIAATNLRSNVRLIAIVKMMMKKYDAPHDPPHHYITHHNTT